jgi:hypothetical protein
MTDPSKHFAAFVSPVDGALVRRYGTETHIGQVQGASRPERRTSIEAADHSTARPNGVDQSLIVPLTHDEWRLYGTEYRRAIAEGSLKARTAEEWKVAEAAAEAAELARVAKLAEAEKAERKRQDDELVAKDRKAKGLDAPSAEQLTTAKKGSDR